jgi:hypothetical protein
MVYPSHADPDEERRNGRYHASWLVSQLYHDDSLDQVMTLLSGANVYDPEKHVDI